METAFPQNFIVHEQPATSFLPALRVTDYSTIYAKHEQANKVIPVFIQVLDSRAPLTKRTYMSNICSISLTVLQLSAVGFPISVKYL